MFCLLRRCWLWLLAFVLFVPPALLLVGLEWRDRAIQATYDAIQAETTEEELRALLGTPDAAGYELPMGSYFGVPSVDELPRYAEWKRITWDGCQIKIWVDFDKNGRLRFKSLLGEPSSIKRWGAEICNWFLHRPAQTIRLQERLYDS